LPDALRASAAMKSIDFGHLNPAMRSRAWAMIAASTAARGA
jgi:hypothetical protein